MEFTFSTTLDAVIGSILKDMRQKLQLEQADVAKVLSFQPSTLSKIETGSIKITVEYVAMLCGTYSVKLSDFFAILEECVIHLRMKRVLVYTPKTVQYIENIMESSMSVSQGIMLGSLGTGVILSILPLPPIIKAIGIRSATVAFTSWLASTYNDAKNKRNDVEKEQLPLDMIELKSDQLSQMLSALLDNEWNRIRGEQQKNESINLAT